MSTSQDPARPVGVHYEGDLRRALVDAAASAIAEVGAEAVSLREVARRLGVSHAAPAHHFVDKAGLLTAVATAGFERFLEHMATALVATAGDPSTRPADVLLALGRAYAAFAEQQSGYFAVMFHPSLIRADDPDYVAASDAAFEALRTTVEAQQHAGWHPEDDTRALAAAAWSFAHGISVLRTQGSLERHYPDRSLDGVEAVASTLLGEGTTRRRAATRRRRPGTS